MHCVADNNFSSSAWFSRAQAQSAPSSRLSYIPTACLFAFVVPSCSRLLKSGRALETTLNLQQVYSISVISVESKCSAPTGALPRQRLPACHLRLQYYPIACSLFSKRRRPESLAAFASKRPLQGGRGALLVLYLQIHNCRSKGSRAPPRASAIPLLKGTREPISDPSCWCPTAPISRR
jgi:hypothetical protein